MHRSTFTPVTRAASAALPRPLDLDDCFLIVDDTDEFAPEIRTIIRERLPRALEVLS